MSGQPPVAPEETERALPEVEGARLLLGSSRDWFASALSVVLENGGHRVERARTAEELVERVGELKPDLVILDECLEGKEIPALSRELVSRLLPAHVPVLLSLTGGAGDQRYVRAYEAGIWAIIEEPIRSRMVLAMVRRLLEQGRVMARESGGEYVDAETGFFQKSGLLKVLPFLEALAARQDAPISCAVVGPTDPRDATLAGEWKRLALECAGYVRSSDLCGWLEDGDLAIVIFDTAFDGADTLLERLNDLVERQEQRDGDEPPAPVLSAGIVDLLEGRGERNGGNGGGRVATDMERLAAARSALQAARRAGGGLRRVTPREGGPGGL